MSENRKDNVSIAGAEHPPFVGDYTPFLEEIKQLPRKKPEDRAEVIRKIAEVREGIRRERTDLAHTRDLIEEAIITNPQASTEELIKGIRLDQYPTGARKAISETINSFKHDRKDIEVVESLLRKKANQDKSNERSLPEKMGKVLYKMVAHKTAAGECEVHNSPFGVWLVVYDDKDFDALKVENAAGYYQATQTIGERGREWTFPLIATRRYGRQGVLIHEEGHAQHSQIRAGLYAAGEKLHKKYWGSVGGYFSYTFFLPRMYASLSKLTARTGIFERYSQQLEDKAIDRFQAEAADLIASCQTQAKNELLAELYNPDGNLSNHLYYLKVEKKDVPKNLTHLWPSQNKSDDNEEERKRVEEYAPYDYLTESGVRRVKKHWLLGKMAQEVRAEYNLSLDRAAKPLINLLSLWQQTGIDTEKMRRRFLYGQLIPEPLCKWGGYIRREFGWEIKILDKLVRAHDRIWQESVNLRSQAEEYTEMGFTKAAETADTECKSLSAGMRNPINEINIAIKTGKGEVSRQVYEAVVNGANTILEAHKPTLERIAEERKKLESEVEAKIEATPLVQTVKHLYRDAAYIQETHSRMETVWQEQIALSDDLSAKFGVPLFEGVWHLEDLGEIPVAITVKTGEGWRKEEKTFDFSSNEVRQAVRDIKDMRLALNRIDRLTISNNSLRRRISEQIDYLEKNYVNTWYPSVFRKYQALSGPLDPWAREGIEAEKRELQEVQVECDREFEKVRGLLGKYQSRPGVS